MNLQLQMGTKSVFFLKLFWQPLCARVTWSKSTADRLFWTETGRACIRQNNKTQLLNRYRVSLSINIFCREEFPQSKNYGKTRIWRVDFEIVTQKDRKNTQSRNWRQRRTSPEACRCYRRVLRL